jgi:hypothetical protein
MEEIDYFCRWRLQPSACRSSEMGSDPERSRLGARTMNRARFVSPSIQDFVGGGYHYNPRQVLSDELGLRFPAVDWTIFKSDPSRAIEFIELYLAGVAGWKTDILVRLARRSRFVLAQPTL